MFKLSLKDRPVASNIISSAIYSLLLAAGGVVLAYLRIYYPGWFSVALWALVGAALVAIILTAIIVWRRLPKQLAPLTIEGLEAHIREWLDNFQIGTKKVEEPDAHFTLIATFANGRSMTIQRLKRLDRYVYIQSAITLAPKHKALLDSLPDEDRNVFRFRLGAELAAMPSGGYFMDMDQGLIILDRRLPITSELTEGSFLEAVDKLDNAKHRAMALLGLLIWDEEKKAALTDGEPDDDERDQPDDDKSKDFTDIAIGDLTNFYKAYSADQAQKLLASFIGKWIPTVTGKVRETYMYGAGLVDATVVIAEINGTNSVVIAGFLIPEATRVVGGLERATVKISGQIMAIEPESVTLSNCKLLDVKPPIFSSGD